MILLLASSPGWTQDNQGLQVTLTGDSIVNRRLSVYDDPATTGLFQIIRQSDVGFTNFESVIHTDSEPGAAESGGAFQTSPPWTVDELKWAGFNLLSVANNHAFDFGVAGMETDLHALSAAGLTFAGAGENLAMARSAAYLDTRKGRVALVACASTFTPGSLAGEQRPDLIGRPGISPLRVDTEYTVDEATFKGLQKLSSLEGDKGGAAETMLHIGDLHFNRGTADAIRVEANPEDIAGLLASIRDAHRQASWVIVSVHAHESGEGNREIPPEFLIKFAHQAIDAGADIFVGHGPHVLRGIEIYKGRPIFYSLGNFIFENETMQHQPSESYESLGLPATATVADYFDARSKNDTVGFPVDKAVWESLVAKVSFTTAHTLDKIALTPIALGYMEPRGDRGRPRLAPPNQSSEVLATVTRLSASFGTTIESKDGVGVIVLGPR
jgi:poly-gamma-glutamate synthesis protein (capsule biosynthesis protein)